MDGIGRTMSNFTYEILTDDFGTTILRSDGACIPANPANADYQAYLATLVSESSIPTTSQAGE